MSSEQTNLLQVVTSVRRLSGFFRGMSRGGPGSNCGGCAPWRRCRAGRAGCAWPYGVDRHSPMALLAFHAVRRIRKPRIVEFYRCTATSTEDDHRTLPASVNPRLFLPPTAETALLPLTSASNLHQSFGFLPLYATAQACPIL